MIPPITLGDVYDLFVRGLIAVRAAIDMDTRIIEMGEGGGKAQARGGRGRHEAVEFRHPRVVERIQGMPEGVIIEMAGLHAGGNEARDRLILEKMGDEGALVIEKTQTVEHHGLDRMACGHHPHCRVLLGGFVHDLGDAEFFKHARDKAKVI